MKKIRRVSGQAIVEFALVIPLILLISVMFIDLGRIVYYHSALNNAVREGTRYAIVTQFPSIAARDLGVQTKVINYAVALPHNFKSFVVSCKQMEMVLGIPTGKLIPQVNPVNPCAEYVTVSAELEVAPMIPFLAQAIGADVYNIKAESTMQMTPYGSYVE